MDFRESEAPSGPSTSEEEERTGLFRETLTVAGRRFDLVARQPVGGRWAAWVQRAAVVEEPRTLARPLLLAGAPVASLAEFARGSAATGTSAGEALETLAAAIRAAVGEATDPGSVS